MFNFNEKSTQVDEERNDTNSLLFIILMKIYGNIAVVCQVPNQNTHFEFILILKNG